jgi:hypothetical protein
MCRHWGRGRSGVVGSEEDDDTEERKQEMQACAVSAV